MPQRRVDTEAWPAIYTCVVNVEEARFDLQVDLKSVKFAYINVHLDLKSMQFYLKME